ncbi:MAG: MFS transporter [SAR202 cluster bacterium]|nr:MFS transporter [SAR202 cluster bacterium]
MHSDKTKEIDNSFLSKKMLLITLTFGHTIVHWYQGLFSLILPFVKSSLSLSDVQIGVLSSIRQSSMTGLNLPSGFIADSYRRYTSLILFSAIMSFGSGYFLMGVTNSYSIAILASAVIGFGTALWHPAGIGALSITYPNNRGTALSIHGVGASIGDSLGPIIVGALFLQFSWQNIMMLHFPASIVAGLIISFSVIKAYRWQNEKKEFKNYLSDIKKLASSIQTISIMASYSFILMGRLVIQTFLPIYISETLGYSSFVLGVYLTLLYVLGMISQPIMGVASDKYGRKMVLAPSYGLLSLLYLGLIISNNSIQLGIVISSIGLFFYAVSNIATSAIMDIADKNIQSSSMGIMGLFSQPFTLIAPILAGFFVQISNIQSAFWFASIVSLIAFLTLLPVSFTNPNEK